MCRACHVPSAPSALETPSGFLSPAGVLSPTNIFSPMASALHLSTMAEHHQGSTDTSPSAHVQASSAFGRLMARVQEAADKDAFALDDDAVLLRGGVACQRVMLCTRIVVCVFTRRFHKSVGVDHHPQDSSPTTSNPESLSHSSLYSPRGDALGASGGLAPLLAVRDAEAALQLHELARGLGTVPAALPLWEEFVVLYHRCAASLEDVLPRASLSQHMSTLAESFSGSHPVLAGIATRWAPMDTNALAEAQAAFGLEGEVGLRLLSGDRGGVLEVMAAHPLRIGMLQVDRLMKA